MEGYEQNIIDFPGKNNEEKEQISSLQETVKKERSEKMKEKWPDIIHILPSRRKAIDELKRVPTPEELLKMEEEDPYAEKYIGEGKKARLKLLAEEIMAYKIIAEVGTEKNVVYLDKKMGKYVEKLPGEEKTREVNIEESPIVSSADAYHRWQIEHDK